MKRWTRVTLSALAGFVGLTAAAGGMALVAEATLEAPIAGLLPGNELLAGTPFSSYLIPGLVLAVVVGGTHIAASLLLGRAARAGWAMATIAGFGPLIWIFVEMVYIPFSPLQAVYFAAGLAELVLVLIGFGLIHRRGVAAS